jgi:hypothetical protein
MEGVHRNFFQNRPRRGRWLNAIAASSAGMVRCHTGFRVWQANTTHKKMVAPRLSPDAAILFELASPAAAALFTLAAMSAPPITAPASVMRASTQLVKPL